MAETTHRRLSHRGRRAIRQARIGTKWNQTSKRLTRLIPLLCHPLRFEPGGSASCGCCAGRNVFRGRYAARPCRSVS